MPYRFLASMMAAVDPALGGLIRLTVTPTGNRVLTLRDFTEPIDCTVDWGDGTSDAVTSNTPVSHTYADGKARTLTITGRLGGFWNAAARAAGTTFVTSVDAIVSPSLVTLAETFRQCTSLAKLPATVDAPALANCDRAFLDCRSIASDFPALWMTHTAATHANAFTRCFLSFWGKLGSGCTSRSYVAAVAAQTYYQKYGTNCSARSYVAGTSGQTYYQKYGTSCSSRSYVSGTASRTYYQAYSNGAKCPSRTTQKASVTVMKNGCPYVYAWLANGNTWTGCECKYGGTQTRRTSCPYSITVCSASSSSGVTTCSSSCKRTYSSGTSSYYKCTASGSSGVSKCSSSCRRTYSSGTSAYYRCTQSSASGVGTCGSGCRRNYTSGQSAYYRCAKGGTCAETSCPWAYANQTACDNAKNAGWA